MSIRVMLGILIGVGVLILGVNVYSLFFKEDNDVSTFEEDSRQNKTEVSKQIEVPMYRAWTDTGVQISKGQILVITASGSGVWKNIDRSNPNAVPYPYEECGPEGTSPNARDYHSNIQKYQTSLANKGALIGKIGNGTPFKVGENFRKKMTESGTLYLGINDMKPEIDPVAWSDNSGGFQATVEIQSAQKSKPISKTITVPSDVMLYDTGITIGKGQHLQVSYQSGQWSNTDDVGNIWTDGMGSGSWTGLLLPKAPIRSLIGKVGNNTFFVGNTYDGSPGSGKLYLGMNDVTGSFQDNVGELTVEVTVK